MQQDGTKKIFSKHYCQVDDTGLVVKAKGFSFKESDTKKEEFIILSCPKRCPYILEHLVVKGNEDGNDRCKSDN